MSCVFRLHFAGLEKAKASGAFKMGGGLRFPPFAFPLNYLFPSSSPWGE